MEHFFENLKGYATYEDQGELIKTLLENLKNTDNLKIAEIGVFQGRMTALWNVELMNRNIKYEYFAIDHFLGSSEHDPNFDYYNGTLMNLSPIIDKINILRNDSVSASKKFDNEFFDIVYIDASHEYEFVKQDILTWLPKVKPGGIICGDDYVRGWDGVIQAVDEIFGNQINRVGHQQWWVVKN
jgi:predicted O-methyltransferase YrrM